MCCAGHTVQYFAAYISILLNGCVVGYALHVLITTTEMAFLAYLLTHSHVSLHHVGGIERPRHYVITAFINIEDVGSY